MVHLAIINAGKLFVCPNETYQKKGACSNSVFHQNLMIFFLISGYFQVPQQ